MCVLYGSDVYVVVVLVMFVGDFCNFVVDGEVVVDEVSFDCVFVGIDVNVVDVFLVEIIYVDMD